VLKTLLTESKEQIWKDWDVDHYPMFLGLIVLDDAEAEIRESHSARLEQCCVRQ
jgi:hypothetical protein